MNSKPKINNKNYSNPIGLAILDSIENIPLSASEISNKVDFPREKIYYHLKKLLSAELLYVADTEIINGITKKSYLKVDDPNVIKTSLSSDENDSIRNTKLKDSSITDDSFFKSDETVQINEKLENESFDETSSLVDKKTSEHTEDLNDVNPEIVFLSNENDEDNISESISENEIDNENFQDSDPVQPATEVGDRILSQPSSGSILDKLLTVTANGATKTFHPVENTVEEKTYIETASPDQLTHSITVDDLTYLIPEADYSLGGIDYIVRSAQRQDGIKITIQNKQTLGDYLEYLRIEKDESKLVSSVDFSIDEIADVEERTPVTKPKLRTWSLYLARRLNGYYNAATFAQIDQKIYFLRASINRQGFKILDQEIYNLPIKDGTETINDLASLIKYVYRNKIKKKLWQHLYLAYYSNHYSFEMDPLKTPDLKGKELEGFLRTDISKRFSVESGSSIVNWIEHKTLDDDPQKEFIVALGDRIPIEKDYEILTAQKIQPRFTTSIPKIQYDLYRYNFPEDNGNSILLYIGAHRSFITIVNDWRIRDSRSSVVSADNFIVGQSNVLRDEKTGVIAQKEINGEISEDIGVQLASLDLKNDKKVRAILERLESEIYATLKYFKTQGYYLSQQIFISGIGTNIPNLEQQIAEDFQKEVSKLVLPDSIQYVKDVPTLDGEDFSINIGLLLDPKDRLNLLPKAQRDNNKFISALNLAKIAGLFLITVGSFFSAGNYFSSINIDGNLNNSKKELKSLTEQNDLFYDISYKLAVTDLITGVKKYDSYISSKLIQALKFLSSTLPETILLDQLIFSKGEEGETHVITLIGRISSSGAESNIVLNNMMFYLRDYDLFENVSLREQGAGDTGTLNFTVDLGL